MSPDDPTSPPSEPEDTSLRFSSRATMRRVADTLVHELRTGGGPGARVTRGASAAFVIKVVGTGLVFLNQLILTRVLGVDHYGYYIYTITWVNLLTILGLFGMDSVAIRFIGEYEATDNLGLLRGFLYRGWSWCLALSLALAGVGIVAVSGLSSAMEPGLLAAMRIGALLLPAQVALLLSSAIARGFQRIVVSLLPIEVLRPLLVGSVVLVAWFAFGHRLSAAQTLGWNAVVTASLIGVIFVGLKQPIKRLMSVAPLYSTQTWLAVAGPVLLISGFNVVLSQTDTVMLGLLLDTRQAGIYAVASRIAGLVAFAAVAVNTVAGPLFVELHARGDNRRLKRTLFVSTTIILTYCVPAVSVLLLGRRWILSLFGPAFVAGEGALAILLTGNMVFALCGLAGTLAVMTGKQAPAARILGFAALLNIVLNAALIPSLGIIGAAISTTVTTIGWNLAMVFVVWRHISGD